MTHSTSRRRFLRNSGFLGLSIAGTGLAGCNNSSTGSHLPPAAQGNAWQFPQSVASGDPRPDAIVLWTRIVPAGLDAAQTTTQTSPQSVQLRITATSHNSQLGTDTALSGPLVLDTWVALNPEHDGTLRHKVTGLQPGTVYFYQFTAGTVRSRIGRFKTAPATSSSPAALNFAVLTCQDWSVNHWAAYEDVAQQDLDFFIHMGDYIYETVGKSFQVGSVESRHTALVLPNGTALPDGGQYATTLADYRYLYKMYRSDPRLQAVHERFAMIAMWDDHEFSDDCWGDSETYDNGSTTDNVHQPARRRQANQAWYEFMPADVVYDNSPASTFYNVRLYRDFQFGTLAHLVMTDERLYRADHLIPEGTVNPATGQPLGSIGSRYFVPETLLAATEAQKIAAAPQLGKDSMALVSMLGKTQRDWWMRTLSNATSTWKLWGNEVSLLKMGLDGSQALATLIALQAISTVATSIGQTATQTGGNLPVAAAIVAAVTAGASQSTAGAAAQAVAMADATSTDPVAAAVQAGLTPTQSGLAVQSFLAAKAAAAGGATLQASAGAQVIAMGYIKADILAQGANSAFIPAALKPSVSQFFQKFVVNADQWDGYSAERKLLMQHLKAGGIQNVVALTGDIHAFFAGTVMDDYSAATPTPVMVDLVSAGVSSESFFTYLRQAVGAVSASLSTLIYYPLTVPTPAGDLSLNVNLLDYTLGKTAPTTEQLVDSLRVQVRGALAQKGLPETQLDAITTQVLAGLKASPDVQTQLTPLAATLAGLDNNPWIALANTDAQGYLQVRVTPTSLTGTFKQVNKLVGSTAPGQRIAATTTATVSAGSASVTLS